MANLDPNNPKKHIVDFQLQTISNNQQIVVTKSMDLRELALTSDQPTKTYALKFDVHLDQINFFMALIMDIGVITYSCPLSQRLPAQHGATNIYSFNICEQPDLAKSEEERKKFYEDKYIISLNKHQVRFKLIIEFLKQRHILWLDDKQENDINLFSYEDLKNQQQNSNITLNISLQEVVYEITKLD